jgi:hypothetical protein
MHIPLSDVETMKQKHPQAEIFIYHHAGHGFHCDERGSYDQPSARIAWERSLGFLSRGFNSTAEEMMEGGASACRADRQAGGGGAESAAGEERPGEKDGGKEEQQQVGKKENWEEESSEEDEEESCKEEIQAAALMPCHPGRARSARAGTQEHIS